MNDTPHICPVCKSEVEEYEDYASSSNSNGMWYDIWCPNCGSVTMWYDIWSWPEKKDWQIPKIALDLYKE